MDSATRGGRVRNKVLPLLGFALLSGMFLSITGTARAQDVPTANVTLAWDPSPSTNVVAYRLYYGTAPRTYTEALEAGSNTSLTVSNLVCGIVHYFAATAMDDMGLESDFSEEIAYIPAIPTSGPAQLLMQGGIVQVLGSGPAGAELSVEASEDLITWASLGSVITDESGRASFTDNDAPNHSRRFYRFRPLAPGI